jgi:hypothetical protein
MAGNTLLLIRRGDLLGNGQDYAETTSCVDCAFDLNDPVMEFHNASCHWQPRYVFRYYDSAFYRFGRWEISWVGGEGTGRAWMARRPLVELSFPYPAKRLTITKVALKT